MNRQIDLVYGGGSIGLMGQVAQTVKSGGGHVVGLVLTCAECTENRSLMSVRLYCQCILKMFFQRSCRTELFCCVSVVILHCSGRIKLID